MSRGFFADTGGVGFSHPLDCGPIDPLDAGLRRLCEIARVPLWQNIQRRAREPLRFRQHNQREKDTTEQIILGIQEHHL